MTDEISQTLKFLTEEVNRLKEQMIGVQQDNTNLLLRIANENSARLVVLERKVGKSVEVCREALLLVSAAIVGGGVVDCTNPKGPVARRVLGKLPVTADGCVVGIDAKVYWHEEPFEESIDCQSNSAFFEDHGHDATGEPCGAWELVSACYSTREAAEAAKAVQP